MRSSYFCTKSRQKGEENGSASHEQCQRRLQAVSLLTDGHRLRARGHAAALVAVFKQVVARMEASPKPL